MEVSEHLKSLGFTTNGAKVYLALLECQPATAYEIAKTAGLPTSKIYETVARLVNRAVLQAKNDETGTQQYYALNPPDLMQSIRNNIIKDTERLLPELQKVPTSNQSNLIWPLLNSNQVESRALEIIKQATTSILVSLWPDELDWCERSLMDAEARGVNIALVHFGEPTRKIDATYHHPVQETLYTEKDGRGLTVVVDSAQVVIANFQVGGKVDGAWSRNKSFVTVAEDYVKHDVYITKVTRFLGPEVVARFGKNYTRLRDVFNSKA